MKHPLRIIRIPLAACILGLFPGFPGAASAIDLPQKDGDPLQDLPPYIRKVQDWGQRADFSHDGKRLLFIEKTHGDAFELDLASGKLRPLTHHYLHGGYTRALYLSNGDILLSGATKFDAENAWAHRNRDAELWVLDKSLTKPPVRLGTRCSEGPAVSRHQLRIAWTTTHVEYPDEYAEGEYRVHVGKIEYHDGVPALVERRTVLSNVDNPFFTKPTPIETQNFIPPEEDHITLSLYNFDGGAEVAVVDLDDGSVTQMSHVPGHHCEPEGIFPDGKDTLVESTRHFLDYELNGSIQYIDIWKLSLDGQERWERITHFSDYRGYKASNPVVSDDGRYIAFQMAKLGDPAGVGRGIFLLDLQARDASMR